ncbi:hypothetical protein LTR56_023848 [Elasticomyces elasticus]|nr:hypothetical protein LTR56_023848 [Elasticomyces elasticus]KAK3666846.1 hypothetical protein LTR22_002433 [Elasticomyces elasticus]KAK4907769.1 hypothetical protein LTR49_023233 [Elasticomyces elasticus]KAK5746980.1 hypothetical protein LTS12_022549 [Elasticomyces elasticus]
MTTTTPESTAAVLQTSSTSPSLPNSRPGDSGDQSGVNILFGTLALVLAAISIGLAYLQFRKMQRKSDEEAPTVIELPMVRESEVRGLKLGGKQRNKSSRSQYGFRFSQTVFERQHVFQV